MSQTMLSYVLSGLILAALAMFIPCIELLAKLLRAPLYDDSSKVAAPPSKKSAKSREGRLNA